jgi:hypothetical protein
LFLVGIAWLTAGHGPYLRDMEQAKPCPEDTGQGKNGIGRALTILSLLEALEKSVGTQSGKVATPSVKEKTPRKRARRTA